MPPPKRPSLTSVTRSVADLIDYAVRVGLPEPSTMHLGQYQEPTLIMADFDQVQVWADYHGAPVEFYTAFDCDFATARAIVPGLNFVVTSNRKTLGEAAS